MFVAVGALTDVPPLVVAVFAFVCVCGLLVGKIPLIAVVLGFKLLISLLLPKAHSGSFALTTVVVMNSIYFYSFSGFRLQETYKRFCSQE